MKKTIVSALIVLAAFHAFANDEDSTAKQEAAFLKFRDSVNNALDYETGLIKLDNGISELNIPQGFKFLNKEQSRFVLVDLWDNPASVNVLGTIWPENGGPFADSSYAFVVTYDKVGYVKDGDAGKIDYDQLLKDIQEEEKEINVDRTKNGYSTVHIVGWAQKPYYDKTNKILHWARELHFSDREQNTLNYEIRILGRNGVLSLNAVAEMSELSLVKNDIEKVRHFASFTQGNTYADFDSKVDEVAAWTIGGLVAGKVLAKVGFFAGILAFLAKFAKLIIIGIAGVGACIFQFIRRKKTSEELAYQAPSDNPPNV